MNNLKLVFIFLFLSTITLMAQVPNKFIDLTQDQGIIFYDNIDNITEIGDTAIIDFHGNNMGMDEYNYLKFRATYDKTKDNNMVLSANGRLTIGTIDPDDNYKLLTDSTTSSSVKLFVKNGIAVCSDWSTFSDQRLKQNIQPYNRSLETLEKFNFYEYEYNGLAGTPTGKRYVGVIAQEIKEILPNTVSAFSTKLRPEDTAMTSLYTYNPSELLYVAINSIKELAVKTENLTEKTKQLSQMEAQYNDLKEELSQIKQFLGLDESSSNNFSKKAVIGKLDNCVPNPSSNETVLSYEIFDEFKSAEVVLNNLNGQQIELFKIKEIGTGQIMWEKGNLPNGVYTFALFVDNILVDVKRVIMQ